MELELTDAEAQALQFIDRYVKERGFAPTVREVQGYVGHSSVSSTHYMLTSLKKRGLVTWDLDTFRTLRVVQPTPDRTGS